jgi:hypothetical protein
MGLFSFRDDYQVSPIQGGNASSKSSVTFGVVKKVHLDFSSEANGRSIVPGAIEVEAVGKTKNNTIIAYPYDEQYLDIPCTNELVDIFFQGTIPMYRRFSFNRSINNSVPPPGQNPNGSAPKSGLDNFKTLGGVVSSLAGADSNLGDYFKKQKIHRLRLFEGDTIVQSRFGQSIRLSGYNNSGNNFAPTITIRNRESQKNSGLADSSAITEDLNNDGSTILLTSGDDNTINFTPGVTDKLAGSNFKNRPDKSSRFIYIGKDDDHAFEAFPKTYNGEQIFITSDRLVFSSRKNEMIFWSKGHYGIITDGIFSVDTDLGMNLNSKGDVDIQAYEKQINFYIGDSGEINLGNKNLKPAVDGSALTDILKDLIACIINLKNGGLLTPAGPTAGMDPIREGELKEIATRLSAMVSSRVKIQF